MQTIIDDQSQDSAADVTDETLLKESWDDADDPLSSVNGVDCECKAGPKAKPFICNALLTFLIDGMQRQNLEDLRARALNGFSPNAIKEAKCALWSNTDAKTIGRCKLRKGSTQRPREEFEIDDILEALKKIDADKEKLNVHVSAYQLRTLPYEGNPDNGEKLSAMDGRLSSLENAMQALITENAELRKRVEQVLKTPAPCLPSQPCGPPPPPHLPPRPSPSPQPGASDVSQMESVQKKHRRLSSADEEARDPHRVEEVEKKPSYAAVVDDEGFEMSKAPRRNRRTVLGKRSQLPENCSLRAVPPPPSTRTLFVARLDKKTTAEGLRHYIKTVKSHIKVNDVKRISHDKAFFSSFKLDVSVADFNVLMNGDLWPEGTCVRRFIHPRKTQVPNGKSNDNRKRNTVPTYIS